MNQSYFLLVFVLPTVFDENKNKISSWTLCWNPHWRFPILLFAKGVNFDRKMLQKNLYAVDNSDNYAQTIAATCFTTLPING